jgi:hypothetical protein
MKQASKEATILPYAPILDRLLEAIAEFADRVFCFYDKQGAWLSQGRCISEETASQTTSEAFSRGGLGGTTGGPERQGLQ